MTSPPPAVGVPGICIDNMSRSCLTCCSEETLNQMMATAQMYLQLTASSERSDSTAWVLSSPSWEAWRTVQFSFNLSAVWSKLSITQYRSHLQASQFLLCQFIFKLLNLHKIMYVNSHIPIPILLPFLILILSPFQYSPNSRVQWLFLGILLTFPLCNSTLSLKPLSLLNSYWLLDITCIQELL